MDCTLLKEVVSFYNTDSIKAGLQVSFVNNKQYYVAVHRFYGGLDSRKVVAQAKSHSFGVVLLELYHIWRNIRHKDNYVENNNISRFRDSY